MKNRLDNIVADKLNISRSKAKEIILDSKIKIGESFATKPGQQYDVNIKFWVDPNANRFVSRGGYKLESAINHFKLDVSQLVCIDIGASTGGFTHCLLQNNAAKVYALDVGTNQLESTLREDKRVVSIENTHIKDANLPMVQLIVIDVSFISLATVIPYAYKFLQPKGKCVALVKPQFEVGPKHLTKKGLVKNRVKADKIVLKKIEDASKDAGFVANEVWECPVRGGEGNIEYFIFLEKK